MQKAKSPNEAVKDRPVMIRTHSDDGVDLTLIRWMLSLTPAERLQVLQGYVDSVLELRGMKLHADDPSA